MFSSVQGGERPAAVCQSRLNRGATGTEDGTQHLVGLLRRHKPLALLLSPGRPAFFFSLFSPSLSPVLMLFLSKRQQREQPSAGGAVKRAMSDVFDPSGGEASVLVVWSSLCFRLGYSERLAVSGFLFCYSQTLSSPPFSCSQLAHDTN